MKHFLPYLFAIFCVVSRGFAFDHSSLSDFLDKFVDSEGMVDYQGVRDNIEELNLYIGKTENLSRSDFDDLSEDHQIAFLVNLYNAATLKLIANNYPIGSIRSLNRFTGGPWKQKFILLFEEMVSLDHIEHEVLRVEYDEPRIHLGLVCAAISCPPLAKQAFSGEGLSAELDKRGELFFQQEEKNRIEGSTLYLSSIFKWFGEDFGDSESDLKSFANKYLEGAEDTTKIRFTDYNWSLNEQR